MDKELFKLIDNNLPKFNEKICNGFATTELRHALQYIDNVWRCAAESFPPGLKYIGAKPCTTEEEIKFILRKLTPSSTLELAKSSTHLTKFLFSYNDKELEPQYLSLPFVNDDGLCSIHGSQFYLSPVLADQLFSVNTNSIFIQLHRAKLTFYRLGYKFLANNERQISYIVYSTIYNLSGKRKTGQQRSVKAMSTMTHYLFAKYGVTETFKRFARCDIVVMDKNKINENEYNKDEWVICQSIGLKPATLSGRFYNSSNLCLLIKVKDYNFLTQSMIAAFFYIVDHFPERVEPEYIDETRLWIVLLGRIIFGDNNHEGKIADDIINHLRSLDDYLDNDALLRFKESGVYCRNIYDLFHYINDIFSTKLTESIKNVTSMYGKRLMLLRYVLGDITSAINTMMFRLNSSNRKTITENDIINEMRMFLKHDLITRINNGHGEVSSINCSGDNKLFKYTCLTIPQTKSSSAKNNSRGVLSDPSNLLHMSIVEVGNAITPGKSDPTGRSLLNPYVLTDVDGRIIRNPKFIELLDEAQKNILR